MIIDSRDPYDLDPGSYATYMIWQEKCAAAGYDVRMISGYRNKERQNQIYDTVDAKGHRATGARGGQSFHQYRVAWDFAIYKSGKIDWYDAAGYEKCGKIGEALGCFWGGNWKALGDNGHLQTVNCSSISASGLPQKYPSGERDKNWNKTDCDAALAEMRKHVGGVAMPAKPKPITVGTDKPKAAPVKAEPKGDYSHVNDAVPEAEKPTVAGFFGYLFDKLRGGGK